MSNPPPPLLEPLYQQQQAYTSDHSGHDASFGSVIAILAVTFILGAIAVMVGKLCSGKSIMGHGPHYNMESWVETKCSTCIDGSVEAEPLPRRVVVEHRSSTTSASEHAAPPPPMAAAVKKEEEASDQSRHPHQGSL